MDVGAILKLSVVFAVIVVPALGFTARFALKPIVDAIIRIKESTSEAEGQRLNAQMAQELLQLRAEVAQLQQSVSQLREAESFHALLASPPKVPASVLERGEP